MAGFFRGLALIGAIALYSPVNHQGELPSWTEGAGNLQRVAAEAASIEKAASHAAASIALDAGKALAGKFAELDPETRRLMLDMSLSAAARIATEQKHKHQGEAERR